MIVLVLRIQVVAREKRVKEMGEKGPRLNISLA